MNNTLSFLETSRPNFPETADLRQMPPSADCLDRGLTPEKKVEELALPLLFSEKQACMNLSTAELLDDDYFKTPPLFFPSEIDHLLCPLPCLPCPASNPDQTPSSGSLMLVETKSQLQPTSDEGCDPVNPLSSEEVKRSEPPCPSTSCLYPTTSNLNHQEPPFEQAVSRQAKLNLWRMSDTTWALVEPLLSKKVKSKGDHRSALNSILLMAINGVSGHSLPKKPHFSRRDSAHRHFNFWRDSGTFKSALLLLEKKSREPFRSYYQNLSKNFQKASNQHAKLLSIQDLKLKSGQVRSRFRGVTNKQWNLVEPLLTKEIKSRENHRTTLNSIFLMLINGVASYELPVGPDFARKSKAYKYLSLWKKNGKLEKVLIRLIEGTEGTLQSDYRKLMNNLQRDLTLSNKKIKSSGAPCASPSCPYPMTSHSDQSSLFSSKTLEGKEAEPQLRRISDEAWVSIEPLLAEEVNSKGDFRSALNSILFMVINGAPARLIPTTPHFSRVRSAQQYFRLWQENETFEKVLIFLEKEAQGPSKSSYRNLLENLQKASNSYAEPPSIEMLKSMCKSAESDFRGLTDEEWTLVEPLLRSRTIKSRNRSRSALNSILSMLIDGVQANRIPVNQDFACQASARKYFHFWRASGTLEKVLDRLVEVTQDPLQSDYRNLLKHLQNRPYLQTKHLSIVQLKLSVHPLGD